MDLGWFGVWMLNNDGGAFVRTNLKIKFLLNKISLKGKHSVLALPNLFKWVFEIETFGLNYKGISTVNKIKQNKG